MENKLQNPSKSSTGVNPSEKRLLAKKVIFTAGLTGIAVGFYLLTWVDRTGQNWASVLSPLLIVGGYIAIIIALLLKV